MTERPRTDREPVAAGGASTILVQPSPDSAWAERLTRYGEAPSAVVLGRTGSSFPDIARTGVEWWPGPEDCVAVAAAAL